VLHQWSRETACGRSRDASVLDLAARIRAACALGAVEGWRSGWLAQPSDALISGLNADPRVEEAEFRKWLEDMTLLKRLPTLAEVASTAVFLASDHAGSITGAVANLTGGMSLD
jgi:NAD(P)-dependent dehydrogenase (short-subunit alcohol dehydrogenase family)